MKKLNITTRDAC